MLHAVEHPRPARDAIGTPSGTLQLDRRVANAVPAADRLDLLERTVRIVGAGMDAESNEAMTDGPNVQIVDVEHPGDRRDVAVDIVPVHVGRYLLEEDRNAAANHPDGGVKYDHAKQDGANWIDGAPIGLPPDGEAGDEDRHRLGQIPQNVNVRRVQIDVALLLPMMLMTLVIGLCVRVRNLVGVQPLQRSRRCRCRRPIHCLGIGAAASIPFGRLGHVGKEQTLLLAAARVARVVATATATIAAVMPMSVGVPMFVLVLVGMSMVAAGQMDVMLAQHKGQDDVDDHANEGDQAHQSAIDVQVRTCVGPLLLPSNPAHDEGPQTPNALHQEKYRHDRQRGHGKQRRQRLGPLVSEGKVRAGGERRQVRRGDGHDEGGQVGEEVGGIGQDGQGTGQEAADHLDEEEGAAQEGGDLEAAEDEGALVLVGGGTVVTVMIAVVPPVLRAAATAAAAHLGRIAAPVLAVTMVMVVAVRVAAAHLSRG